MINLINTFYSFKIINSYSNKNIKVNKNRQKNNENMKIKNFYSEMTETSTWTSGSRPICVTCLTA